MIWKIVKEGFLLNLTTFKFSLGTLPCIVLSGGIRARLCRWLSAEAGRTNELSGIQQD